MTSKEQKYKYMNGFGNHFSSEALKGALPYGQNSPQVCPYGLYAEQLSGTAFTAPRAKNQRSWLYKIRPSVKHLPFKLYEGNKFIKASFDDTYATPQQMRWMPHDIPTDTKVDFVDGIKTIAGAGSAQLRNGVAIHIYTANTSMKDRALCNADGDFLIVPQQGELDIQTEFGNMTVKPGEITVIQRGIKFRVSIEGPSRGYIAELFSGNFTIPDLGPIGANGLANPRDFLTPVAAYEDVEKKYTIIQKFQGKLFSAEQDHSPFDVVAWHGNYAPYKYDLSLFNTINSVSFDHPDPSIYTVLTCQSNTPGTAIMDFVIFPPRWVVMEKSFRPPYYHRNIMSEFMGLISGTYDAKEKGFVPGGSSLHNCMSPHGPETDVFIKSSTEELKPFKMPSDSLAFMFETMYMLNPTEYAMKNKVDEDYYKCWQGLKKHFNPDKIDVKIEK